MKELFDTLAGEIFLFGYSVPTIWLIASGFLLLGAVMRSLPLAMVAGLIFLVSYMSTMASM